MDILERLQVAAQLAEQLEEDETLPDSASVATQAALWGVEGTLKPHQAQGVAWLIRRYVRGVNVILGDEVGTMSFICIEVVLFLRIKSLKQMGLGKTLQAITLISYLKYQRHSSGPFFILCPLSVTENWVSELSQFSPKLHVLRYVGDKDHREEIRKMVCKHVCQQKGSQVDPIFPFDVLVTTYELAMVDVAFLSRIRWKLTVIDEAQRLKNHSSVLYLTLKEKYMIPRHLLLTGTPVQNNLEELWSLLHFSMPMIFNDLDNFLSTFGPASKRDQECDDIQVTRPLKVLRQILNVFMLRRTKAHLVQQKALVLPPLSEVTIMVDLVPLQRNIYISVLKKELPKILTAKSDGLPQTSLQNIVMQLRKACSHPYLFPGVEPEPFEEGDHLVQASGKLLVLDSLLKNLFSGGHRVLIYAQMTRTLDILQDCMELRGYTYERLDGSVRAEERFAAVKNFSGGNHMENDGSRNGKTFVFLLSTRAGGVGLNLTSADTVIFYEQDWNPQADQQALQRAHRIGQTLPVLAINIVTHNTVEEVIVQRAKRKLKLAHTVVGTSENNLEPDGLGSAPVSDLHSMITFGLHELHHSGLETEQNITSESLLASKINGMVQNALQQRQKDDSASGCDGLIMSEDGVKESIYWFEGQDFSTKKRESDDEALNASTDRHALDSWLEKISEADVKETGSRRVLKRAYNEMSDGDLDKSREEKQRKLEEKKEARWKVLGYSSTSVEDPAVNEDDISADSQLTRLHFVFGDCTKPIRRQANDAAIIFSVVDNSGVWGSGGMLDALARVSSKICDAYETAHKAGDLHLGDVHLIEIHGSSEQLKIGSVLSTSGDETGTPVWVAIAVAQSYDRRRKVPRSEISLTALEICIRKAASSAASHSASVHMPRIGDRKEWYAVERLLRKYASIYDVHFFIYYFKRARDD